MTHDSKKPFRPVTLNEKETEAVAKALTCCIDLHLTLDIYEEDAQLLKECFALLSRIAPEMGSAAQSADRPSAAR